MDNHDTHNMLKAPKRFRRAGNWAQRFLASVSAVLLILSAFPIIDRPANAVEPVAAEYTNLVVQKKWVGPAMADSVKYHLEAYDRTSGAKVEVPSSVAGLSGTVTKDGGWRTEVTNLPAKVAGADVDYRVVEDDVPAGYIVDYSESTDFMDVDSYWVDVHLKFQLSKSTDKGLVVEYKYGDDDAKVINVPRSIAANGESFAKGEVVEYTVKQHTSLPLDGEPKDVEVLSVTSDKKAVAANSTVDGGSYAEFAPASKKAVLAFTSGADVSGTRVKVTYSYKGQECSFILEPKEYGKWLRDTEYKLDITDKLPDLDGASGDLELVEIAKIDSKGNFIAAVELGSKSAEIVCIPNHIEAALVFTAPATIYQTRPVRFTYIYQGKEYIYEVAKGDHIKWGSGERVEVPLPMNLEWDPNSHGELRLTKIEVLNESGDKVTTTYQETYVDKGSTSELTTEAAGTTSVEVKALVMTGQPDHALVLSKTIKGSKTVNLATSFPFQVTIADAHGNELSGEFDCRGYSSVPGQTSPGDGKVKSGDTVNLAHGQGVIVTDIPDNTTVAVKELSIPGGFDASVNGVNSAEFQDTITSQNRSLVADYVNQQSDPWMPAYPDSDQDKVIVTKKIESLSKEDPFGDTKLTGDDFYRLYLDITGARDARGYDFLFIVDTTTSMSRTFDAQGYMDDHWKDEPGRRIYEMDKILNGSHKQMSNDGLVSQILAANPNNRVAVGSFSGSTKGKVWKLEGDDPNANNYARTLLEWTDTPGYVNVYDDVNNSTNYGSGFIKGAQLLDGACSDGNKKVVVFMSDGFPNGTFVDYDNGSKVDPGKGTSVKGVEHKSNNYFTNDFARFKENCRDLYGEDFFKDIDLYAVGINSNESGVAILKSFSDDWASLGGCSKYYFAGSAQKLIDSYEEIISKYLVSNVSISDPLSQWVELYQDQADIKISCTHYDEAGAATNTEVVWSGSCASGVVSGAWCGTAANGNGDDVIDSVTFESSDAATTRSTGEISVKFNPKYKLGNVTYALSFNVKVTDAAKNYDGAMPDVGDPDTDKRTDMKTSSGQPGFYSNNEASAKYKMGSEPKDRAYPKPVVQAVPKNLDWVFYKVDEKDNPIEGAEFSLYRCDNAKPDHTHSPSVTADSDCCWTAADTSTVVSATSDSTGLVSFTGLESGDYVLVETKTKGGYQLPAGQWRLTIDAAQGTVSDPQATEGTELPPAFKKGRIGGDSSAPGSEEVLMLPNYPSHDLPFTGIKIPLWALIIGTLLVTAAAGWLAKKNHQDRATRQDDF